VRTALSMISFGFTIYKLLQVLQEESTSALAQRQSPREVGLTLIGIGTFALIVASVQYRQHVKRLGAKPGYHPLDLTFLVACLLGLLGLLMFWGIILNTGPFG
jgi:putative membrane protein